MPCAENIKYLQKLRQALIKSEEVSIIGIVLIECCKCATTCLLCHVTVKQAIVEHIGIGQHGLTFRKISDELKFG